MPAQAVNAAARRGPCQGERCQGMLFRQTTDGEDMCIEFASSLRAGYCQEGRMASEDREGQISPSPALEASGTLVITETHISTLHERRLQEPPSFQLPNSDSMLERGSGRPSLGRERGNQGPWRDCHLV